MDRTKPCGSSKVFTRDPCGGTRKDGSHLRALKALEACGWWVSGKGGAADLLGLRPSALDFRIKKHGTDRAA